MLIDHMLENPAAGLHTPDPTVMEEPLQQQTAGLDPVSRIRDP